MGKRLSGPCNFPLFISLEGKTIYVYGGGTIALRRVKTLISFGAAVRVAAPWAKEELLLLAGQGKIIYERRCFSLGELSGCETPPFLVLAATDNPEVNGRIVRECRERGIPVNHAGDKNQCDFYFPAVARNEGLVIGLTAGGDDHKKVKRAASWLRDHMAEMTKMTEEEQKDMMMTKSEQLFQQACGLIPGGVNSPVRAFGSVGETPRFIKKANGPFMTDADGNQYLDYICSWGPMILGHNHPAVREKVVEACMNGLSYGAPTEAEVHMAELICQLVPSVEMVRMVNSGTEAVMSAIRAARGFTGRNKIIKFAGCYHGHSDALLVRAGSGVMTAGVPDSSGVPEGCIQDTLTAIYNDADSVKALFESNPDQIAAVIVEPVAANMGVIPPKEGFLEELRAVCSRNQSLLIFDEVITGFRLGIDGAQGYYGIRADLVTYGKIIGGGMPVGAYGGRKEVMEMVAPVGAVYQAGTLSGNPVAMAAGIAQLTILKEHPEIYRKINALGEKLYSGMDRIIKETGAPCTVNYAGSLGCMFFTEQKAENYVQAKTADTKAFARYFRFMLSRGVHLAPSQFEAMFLSGAHTEDHVELTLELVRQALLEQKDRG